jgi:uncharacterized protein
VNPFIVRLTFHGNLEFFSRSKTHRRIVERTLREKTSVKDIIESCGIPHPEVDAILVNRQSVGFNFILGNDAEVEVFPVGDIHTVSEEQHLQCARFVRFVSDGHLGKLARNLRVLGFDVAYEQNADDRQLLDKMAREKRALLTRDRRLLMHAIVQHGYYPRSQDAEEQTVEVIRRFNLLELIVPFTRCVRCNARLEEVAKVDIIDKLEPLTKLYYERFRRCTGCGQIYWPGSHFEKLLGRIAKITKRVADVSTE